MKFRLEMDCDNAAFEFVPDNPGAEIARILVGEVFNAVEHLHADEPDEGKIRDFNGNVIGKWKFTRH